MFTIPYVIGNYKLEKAMLDLGASINVMPLSIYKDLNLGPIKETKVIIQLVDRSISLTWMMSLLQIQLIYC
jgi:hypothetical protein